MASHNNHPTSLASSWDISFLKSLVQQDPKGSNKVAHLFILYVYVSPNRKHVNLSIIYYILNFSFLMSQDDAYYHIHQNDPIFHNPDIKEILHSNVPGNHVFLLLCPNFGRRDSFLWLKWRIIEEFHWNHSDFDDAIPGESHDTKKVFFYRFDCFNIFEKCSRGDRCGISDLCDKQNRLG